MRLQQGIFDLRTGPSAVNGVDAPVKHRVVSMFSGCGGMDLGFRGGFTVFGRHYPRLPFEVIWANDLNAAACRTYRHNLDAGIRQGDVWALLGTLPEQCDVLIGGFPCQDISVNGKGTGVNGARSSLYRPWSRRRRACNQESLSPRTSRAC